MNKFLHTKAAAEQLATDFDAVAKRLDLSAKATELKKYEEKISAPDFWQQAGSEAQAINQRKSKLQNQIQPWLDLRIDVEDLSALVKSCDQEVPDDGLTDELATMSADLQARLEDLKEQLKFSGPYDDCEVILSILAGAGGTDAQDWTQMLLRMYTRWAEQKRIKVELISQSRGEEAGLKSVSLYLRSQPFLYGRLKGEGGVHRLVRLSPFNAQNLRQTSFAKVEILPILDQPETIGIKEADLRIDTYRSGGHGGQSVNTTDSAVRITHLPTQLTVTIQNERSQAQNKELALTILHSKLAQLQAEKNAKTISDLKGENVANEWGSQIRNYVLHPYKQVKDLRSQYATSEVQKVLDGQLDELLQAYLAPPEP